MIRGDFKDFKENAKENLKDLENKQISVKLFRENFLEELNEYLETIEDRLEKLKYKE